MAMRLYARQAKNCDLPLLFNHLVGAKQDRLRHRKAERLGGLESRTTRAKLSRYTVRLRRQMLCAAPRDTAARFRESATPPGANDEAPPHKLAAAAGP
jgi:hypothetical protein